jgi:hypothetical protein
MLACKGQNPNYYWQAKFRGVDFFNKCVSHMTRIPSRGPQHRKFTDDDILESAKPFKHVQEWRKAARSKYAIAHARGKDFYGRCTAHMTPTPNPFVGNHYLIYAYEFTDGFAYVGLTHNQDKRQSGHEKTGPVHDHALVTPGPSYKQLESGLDRQSVQLAECTWMTHYQSMWKMLNTAPGGSLGGNYRIWTPDALLLDALKYETKNEWRLKSQYAYKEAKRQDCFDECVLHMPKRTNKDLLGRTFSDETKEKMRQAKLGKVLSDDHKRKIGDSVLKTPKSERAAKISAGMRKR